MDMTLIMDIGIVKYTLSPLIIAWILFCFIDALPQNNSSVKK